MVNPKNSLQKAVKKEDKKLENDVEYMERCLEFGDKQLVYLENQKVMMNSSLERIDFILNAISLYTKKGLDEFKQKRFDFVKKEFSDAYKTQYDHQLKEIEIIEAQLVNQKEFMRFEVSITKKLKGLSK